jgi:hypothetical protein
MQIWCEIIILLIHEEVFVSNKCLSITYEILDILNVFVV